ARYHCHTNAGATACRDGLCHPCSRWILDPHKSKERESVLSFLSRFRSSPAAQVADSNRHDPETTGGHPGSNPICVANAHTPTEYGLRSPSDDRPVDNDERHPSTSGVKRKATRDRRLLRPHVDVEPASKDVERDFQWVALRHPAPVAEFDPTIRGNSRG